MFTQVPGRATSASTTQVIRWHRSTGNFALGLDNFCLSPAQKLNASCDTLAQQNPGNLVASHNDQVFASSNRNSERTP